MDISNKIIKMIDEKEINNPYITFLCIGTDKVIGDSLGPIIGTNIEKFIKKNDIKNIDVIGNLIDNLNNSNIEKYKNVKGDIIIAIDSAISNTYKVGDIIVDEKQMNIRQALDDKVDTFSNINIKCIVGKNFNDKKANFIMLQNLSLKIILEFAEKISSEIYNVIKYYN